ncbi:MAG: zincin-like metallopeptidase domain-containing protein [Synechococcaceae cyanobacterium ELA445]
MASSTKPRRKARPAATTTPADRLVESLITLMEAGNAPWRREWDASTGGHHVNLLTGHRYRGSNPVLLTLGMHLRGSVLPYWCGYSEAKAAGLVPRKGSQAVRILRPHVHSGPETPDSALVDQPEAAGSTWVSYRPVAVFNASDLVGAELSTLIERRRVEAVGQARPEPERLAKAEAVLGAWPVGVLRGGDRACYLPSTDQIRLPELAAFHSSGAYYATWAHEVVHSTGHSSRLARDLSGPYGSDAYAREELVAELGAVLLGDLLEVGSAVENHAAYLQHWVRLLRESPAVLFQVLGEARRAVELVENEPVKDY